MSYPYIFNNDVNVGYALYFIGRHGAVMTIKTVLINHVYGQVERECNLDLQYL